MAFPERLDTARLTLRRWTRADEQDFCAIWADPVVWESLMPGREFSPGYGTLRLEHHLGHWERHGYGLFAVVIGATGEVAGWAGPSHPDFVPTLSHELELGWTLRRPFWGQGLATEAAAAARDACFAQLDVARVISLIGAGNEPSRRVAERLGMRRVDLAQVAGSGVELDVYEVRRTPD